MVISVLIQSFTIQALGWLQEQDISLDLEDSLSNGKPSKRWTIVILEKKLAQSCGKKGETNSAGKIDNIADYLGFRSLI